MSESIIGLSSKELAYSTYWEGQPQMYDSTNNVFVNSDTMPIPNKTWVKCAMTDEISPGIWLVHANVRYYSSAAGYRAIALYPSTDTGPSSEYGRPSTYTGNEVKAINGAQTFIYVTTIMNIASQARLCVWVYNSRGTSTNDLTVYKPYVQMVRLA